MKTKEKVLEILFDNIGKSVSGENIAKSLNITRNSVWNAVSSLKKDGYNIASSTNSGYTLTYDNDIFNEKTIKKYLNYDHKIIIFDEIDSTNNVAKELAKTESEGTVVIAKKQNGGKGRLGRKFLSNFENGLYMTIILKPQNVTESVNITVLCAVAVYEAVLETSGIESSIKWVNDIYIADKKICGILTEGSVNMENLSLDYAVCGMGVNITPPENGFDESIKDVAGAIFEKNAPYGYKSRLCASIINHFFKYYNKISEKEYIKLYREKSNIINEKVSVFSGESIVNGTAIDIDENANLIVKTNNGEILKFSSGEARVRKNAE